MQYPQAVQRTGLPQLWQAGSLLGHVRLLRDHQALPARPPGRDCRSCEIYGAHDELEELGSIINALSNNLGQRERLALDIAEGDLTQEVPLASEEDTLGMALSTMNDSLRNIIGLVQVAGGQISVGSGQVSESSQDLSHGAVQQASALEQISSSMAELQSSTRGNAESARQVSTMASEAMQAAAHGNEQMSSLNAAMTEISQASGDIGKIIKTIDEIAFQTNLLALNAAVEAARAGQQGKGFAVVAEEVRNLAARSATAAAETAELIEGSVKKTENGALLTEQTMQAFKRIVDGIQRVGGLAGEMARAAQQQADGIEQINVGLGQVDSITQKNAASAEESAAAAEELASQAQQLREMLRHFTLDSQAHQRPGVSAVKAQGQPVRSLAWGA